MEKLSTPVGCGYDYFANPTSFSSRLKGRPILDVDDQVCVSKLMETDLIVETRESIDEFYTSFDIQTEVQGQYKLFSASAGGGFKSKNKEKQQYAYTRVVAIHRRARHTYTGIPIEQLNKTFSLDINGNDKTEELTPYDLRTKYGTHVITDAVLGGLIEVLFVTERRENESAQEIEAKIRAAYGALISGSVNTSYEKERKEILGRSTMNCKTVGGKSLGLGISLENFDNNYKIWADSLNNPEYQQFCGFHEGVFKSSCTPISELATRPTRRSELQDEFEKERQETKGIFGPALESDLGDAHYHELNNDMVTALTQYSVNKTMKKYIKEGYKLGNLKYPTIAAYVLEIIVPLGRRSSKSINFFLYPQTDVEKELPKEFPEELRCKDLYDKITALGLDKVVVNSQGNVSDADGAIIDEAFFTYHVKNAVIAEFGFPSYFTRDDIEDFKALVLVTNGQGGAILTQCFKEFKSIELKSSLNNLYAQITIQNQNEDPIGENGEILEKKPSLLKYTINFKMGSGSTIADMEDKQAQQAILQHFKFIDDNKTLSEYTKEELDEVYRKIDNMYSMEQLYLDFNTLASVSQPVYEGFGLDSQANLDKLTQEVLKQNLQEKIILGRTFKRARTSEKKYAIIPRGYQFSVSAGPKSDNDLRTLNYVINLGGDNFGNEIQPETYKWNWVSEGRKYLQSGVSVINRESFFRQLLNQFEIRVLPDLCLEVRTAINGWWSPDLDWITEFYECSSTTSKPHFEYNDDNLYVLKGNSKENKWSWSTNDIVKDKTVAVPPMLPATCGLKVYYDMKTTATWGTKRVKKEVLPAVVFDLEVKCYVNVRWNGGDNCGDIYHQNIKCYLAIDIDNRGNITLIPIVEKEPLKSYFNRNAWSQFCTFGTIDTLLDRIKAQCQKKVDDAVNDFTQSFTDSFTIGAGWVLPGHGTFTFTNERFSTHGDFAVDVNYCDDDE